MNCTEIHTHIDDFLDSQLDAQKQQEFLHHVGECAACRSRLEQAKAVQSLVANQPVPAMRKGFAEQAMKHARESHRASGSGRHRHWFAAGFGGTLAAGVLLAMLAGPFQGMLTEKAPVNQISMNVNQTHNLNVVFSVPEAMNDVEMELQLSDGLQLASHPDQRVLRWRTSLKQGKNRLPLSVKAIQTGSGEVIARIFKDGKQKEFRIQLNVEQNGSLSGIGRVKNWI